MSLQIEIENTKTPRTKVSADKLGFGQYFSDHMFTLEYENSKWQNPRIQPYGPLQLEPGASVLHYGQALFEGMKAFRSVTGKIHLFRPKYHAERMAQGAERLCMPSPSSEDFIQAIETLVKTDSSWIPNQKDSSLYLRPTLIGTESFLGVRPSKKYLFFIIASPVGAYYAEKSAPVKIWIETEHIRAALGGLGATKAAANYAASLKASHEAKQKGYSQVLWLDASKRHDIEEVGTMNVFFKIGAEVITPSLDGSILAGATRSCVIQILRDWNIKVTERKISLAEVIEAQNNSTLKEVFGTGTAAVISPVGLLANDQHHIEINKQQTGELTERLRLEISGIQTGTLPDKYNWVHVVE